MLARRDGSLASGESRAEHVTDLHNVQSEFKRDLVRVADLLKRERRQDLRNMVEHRKHTLEQVRSEVEAMEAMLDPAQDQQRLDRLMKDSRPVDMKEYVVIPPVIHLTWKTKHLPHYGETNRKAWKSLNKGYKVKVYDDDDIDAYVRKYFGDFMEFWDILKPVQRADVFRYVVMWKEGGVYADIDVEPIRPVREWMGNGTAGTLHWRSANVIIGWEMLTDREDWEEFFASQLQLCQWTFASSPGHEMWKYVLDWMLRYFVEGRHLKYPSVIRSTGPGMFSNAIKDFLKDKYGAQLGVAPLTLGELEQKNLHVGDLLVLKKSAFAPDGMYGGSESTLVRHGFAGSWKGKQGSKEEPLIKPDTRAGTMEKALARLQKEFDIMQESFKADNKGLKKKLRTLKKEKKLREAAVEAEKDKDKVLENEEEPTKKKIMIKEDWDAEENDEIETTDETTETTTKQFWRDRKVKPARRHRRRKPLSGVFAEKKKDAEKKKTEEITTKEDEEETTEPETEAPTETPIPRRRRKMSAKKRLEARKERERLLALLEDLNPSKVTVAPSPDAKMTLQSSKNAPKRWQRLHRRSKPMLELRHELDAVESIQADVKTSAQESEKNRIVDDEIPKELLGVSALAMIKPEDEVVSKSEPNSKELKVRRTDERVKKSAVYEDEGGEEEEEEAAKWVREEPKDDLQAMLLHAAPKKKSETEIVVDEKSIESRLHEIQQRLEKLKT